MCSAERGIDLAALARHLCSSMLEFQAHPEAAAEAMEWHQGLGVHGRERDKRERLEQTSPSASGTCYSVKGNAAETQDRL